MNTNTIFAEDLREEIRQILKTEHGIPLSQRSKIMAKIDEYANMDKWIRVADCLPTSEDLTNGAVFAWSTKTKSAGKVNHMFVKKESQFSHWMRLPQSPK